MKSTKYDVIIIGGSYAGLSAAMSLGRSLRKVMIIDSGKPCNRQTPTSHNLITHDGETPSEISAKAKKQVLEYSTIDFHEGLAVNGTKNKDGFEITNQSGEVFLAEKIVLATGIKDIMPQIKGFAECWAISIIHCPYCHGYEVRNKKTGLMLNGSMAFEFSKMIFNLTKDLSIYTNGVSELTEEQSELLTSRGIKIDERKITEFKHKNGQLQAIVFEDKSVSEIDVIYAKTAFEQQTTIPIDLACKINEDGFISVNENQETTIEGVYACGDNTTAFRSLPIAIAAGNITGAIINKVLVEERF